MTDTLKTIRHRNKVAVVPLPGPFWDNAKPLEQLAILQIEAAKFAAAMHKQEVGGFQIVIIRDGQEPEVVLCVGNDEEQNSGLIVPERKLIVPN